MKDCAFCFSILWELLVNGVKHAGVRQLVATFGYADGELRIGLSDDGKGFQAPKLGENRRNSQGLSRIEQRLQLLGGRVEIESTPGHGSHVTLVSRPNGPGKRTS